MAVIPDARAKGQQDLDPCVRRVYADEGCEQVYR